MSKLPFLFEKHLIYIPVSITHNKKTLCFSQCIVDTGSASTAFEAILAEKLDLLPAPESRIRFLKSIGGKQGFYTRTVDLIQIGEEKLGPYVIGIGDLQSEFHIDGIIGNDFLKNFNVEICYRKKIISLTSLYRGL